MNDYMMFGRTLVCNVVSQDKVHSKMFTGSDRKYFTNSKYRTALKLAEKRKENKKPMTAQKYEESLLKLLAQEDATRRKLKDSDIDYDFPGYVCIPISSMEYCFTFKLIAVPFYRGHFFQNR